MPLVAGVVCGGVLALRATLDGVSTGFAGATASQNGRVAQTAMGARKFVVGGNWKANGSPESVTSLIAGLNDNKPVVDTSKDVEVICAPPAVFLSQAKDTLRKDYAVSAQNMW